MVPMGLFPAVAAQDGDGDGPESFDECETACNRRARPGSLPGNFPSYSLVSIGSILMYAIIVCTVLPLVTYRALRHQIADDTVVIVHGDCTLLVWNCALLV